MEDSDHTPSQPLFELDRDLGNLTSDELLEIEGVLEDFKPIENELGRKLYNAYIRESKTVAGLYPALGPADDDIMDSVLRPLYSDELWAARSGEVEVFCCDACFDEFDTEDELAEHMEAVHNEE